MATSYFPFDGTAVNEAEWRKMAQHWLATGVIDNHLNEFEVFADSTGMQVKVRSGAAWVKGHYFESDAQETFAIGAADATNPRIDRVVIRADFTANTIVLTTVAGTAAATPTAPALTQSATVWEVPLAQVRVEAGVTTIAAGKVTNERTLVPVTDVTQAELDAHINDTTDAHDASAISNAPAGTISSTSVQAAINELDTDLAAHVADPTDAHAASAIGFSPTGTVAATTVQAAIAEVASEAANVHMEAKATAGTTSSESVTWTTPFSSTPIVVVSCMGVGHFAALSARSTTGATATSQDFNGASANVVKLFIAMGPT